MQTEYQLAQGVAIFRYDGRGHKQIEVPKGAYSIEIVTNDAVGLLTILGQESLHFTGYLRVDGSLNNESTAPYQSKDFNN